MIRVIFLWYLLSLFYLYRAKIISTDFDADFTYIIDVFQKSDNDFIKARNELEDSYTIPSNLFEEQKRFILIEIHFCDKNEKKSEDFIWKCHADREKIGSNVYCFKSAQFEWPSQA